jgi:hypothetical protein
MIAILLLADRSKNCLVFQQSDLVKEVTRLKVDRTHTVVRITMFCISLNLLLEGPLTVIRVQGVVKRDVALADCATS